MKDYSGKRRYRFSIHGNPWYWYRQRRNQRSENTRFERPFKIQPGQPIELAPIIEADNLLAVYYGRRGHCGQAPGIDGIGYADLGRSEIAAATRGISQAIRQRRYRPLPAREIGIAKPKGGTRRLKIPPIMERTVAAAMNNALTLVIDNQLRPGVMGCRPGRNIEMLFAQLEAAVVAGDRRVIAAADIRKTFDYVPIDRTVTAFRGHLTNRVCCTENVNNSDNTNNAGIDDVIWLIETILKGHDSGHTKGIAQGCPLSPLALNTLLNQVLDRPLVAACPGIPFWRYVDDLTWACQNASEGRRAIQETRCFLNASGFTIKGEPEPVNLRRQGAHVDLLGCRIRRRNNRQLQFELTREK